MIQSTWQVLEEKTRAWSVLNRQTVADAIWEDYVRVRFARSGDARAIQFLAPYLNHAMAKVRLAALDTAGAVFLGRGEGALDNLEYFTKNPNPAIRDRASWVVAAALTGSAPDTALRVLEPSLTSSNWFVRKVSFGGLALASHGTAHDPTAQVLREICASGAVSRDQLMLALGHVYAGHPTEEVFDEFVALLAPAGVGAAYHQARGLCILVREADEHWYQRALESIILPLLQFNGKTAHPWEPDFVRRDGVNACAMAGKGRGMAALQHMLHLRNRSCTLHAMLWHAPECFVGADPDSNRGPLIELLRSGDVQEQRLAARCLGRLLTATSDPEALQALAVAAEGTSPAVRSCALDGLGQVGASSQDDGLARICADHADHAQTASAAIRAYGLIHLGTGNSGAFSWLKEKTDTLREHAARGGRHCKPFARCIHAAGLVFCGTGSSEPTEYFLGMLGTSRLGRQWNEYHWQASRALVTVEYPVSELGWDYLLQTSMYPVGIGRPFWDLSVP